MRKEKQKLSEVEMKILKPSPCIPREFYKKPYTALTPRQANVPVTKSLLFPFWHRQSYTRMSDSGCSIFRYDPSDIYARHYYPARACQK